MKQGFWKENSIAINVDDLVYIQCGCDGVPDKEKIRLRLTDCCTKNTKVHYDATISLQEAERLLAMLQDVVEHGHKMNEIEKAKVAVNE
jgi:hypothetical protein